ncbi:sensor histidine kinase [Flavobacterium sp. MC2016-06]|jgi:sensor histidine kinase YesM|uniref:sensor histidine kinase n=1 Tax=Flavobacterium sp. MC2016-06 TaxID=2676308 RepID=UPI00209B41BC|nr:sensor histidine kinase [Flavobacterium sp. MC2016-06]
MSTFEKIINYTTAHRVATHVFFWTCVFIMFTNKNTFSDDPEAMKSSMLEIALDEIFSIFLAYFVAYRILPRLMAVKKYTRIFIEFMIGCYILCALERTLVVYVLEPIIRRPPFDQEPILEILTDVPKLFRSYFLHTFSLSVFFIFIKLIKDQYVIQKKALSLEKQKAETELKILKAQLNPHFLFNTLNNIYSLSIINSPITSKSIAVLSDILDCILYRCSSTYVPISQEITLLDNYISLEKLRYDERLSVIFNHSIDQNKSIAPLILLSLVENAFKHGAGEDVGSSPIIDIDLKLENNRFQFTIKNSISQSEIESDSKIGLNNIIQQLDKIYPENYTFNVTKSDTHFVAHLEINLTTEYNLA